MKKYKIGKQLRDLLMRNEKTSMINARECEYLGEVYTFEAVTKKEVLETIDGIKKTLNL